jgi:hypothetical protein
MNGKKPNKEKLSLNLIIMKNSNFIKEKMKPGGFNEK